MLPDETQKRLQQIPSMTELLKSDPAKSWLKEHPAQVIASTLRKALAQARREILSPGGSAGAHLNVQKRVLELGAAFLEKATTPKVRSAINATGIILHTGLGRAVLPECVVDSMISDLKEYTVLAVDRRSGERIERDELIEDLLTELTGAEAATVVNNNAAATMLVLGALAARPGGEPIPGPG